MTTTIRARASRRVGSNYLRSSFVATRRRRPLVRALALASNLRSSAHDPIPLHDPYLTIARSAINHPLPSHDPRLKSSATEVIRPSSSAQTQPSHPPDGARPHPSSTRCLSSRFRIPRCRHQRRHIRRRTRPSSCARGERSHAARAAVAGWSSWSPTTSTASALLGELLRLSFGHWSLDNC